MNFKKLFWNTISEGKNPSSKRVAGCLGWLVCLFASIVGIFYIIQSPDIIELLFWTSCALLGLDSVAGIFKNKPFKRDAESKIRDKEIQ